MKKATGISRRSFLTGAAATGAAAATMGLAACSPSSSTSDAGSSASSDDATSTSTSSSSGDWLGADPGITDDDVTEEVTADVVVVGCSDAGAIAVRSAVEAGASVVVIEKSASLNSQGGDCALINGDVEALYGRDDLDVDEIVETHQMESAYHTKAAIMKRYAEEMSDVFDWIIEADPDVYIASETFEEISDDVVDHAIVPARYPLPDPDYDYHNDVVPTYPATVQFQSLLTMLTCNLELAKSEGDVTEYYGHFAEQLIMEDGACVGVYARNAETGGYLKATANSGVILCTGDYSSNTDMLQEFAPETIDNGIVTLWVNTDVEGNMTNTGDGHKMGVRAGAKMQQWHAPMIHHMGGSAGADGRGVMGINGYLQLNLQGKRFMNEDVPGQQIENQLELQPQKTSYQFFDSAWGEQVSLFPAAHGVVCYYSEADETTSINQRCQGDIDAAVEDGRALTADTIEELLAQIEDMDTDTALASIERYNELCAAGVDEDFGKMARRMLPLENPPYYAVKFEPNMMLVCCGGLESDEECHTYDENDEIIPGLYVAGNVQGNRFAVQYPISLCGLSVGMAMFYGYVAGQNAAAGV